MHLFKLIRDRAYVFRRADTRAHANRAKTYPLVVAAHTKPIDSRCL